MPKNNIHQLSINTIRCLAIDAIQKANSGHPGMPMGCAPIAYMLYTKYMKHNPENPGWVSPADAGGLWGRIPLSSVQCSRIRR